jgi:hypothetical protein
MAYTVVDGFRQGLVRHSLILSLAPGALYTAQNVHVTQGGELEKRQDTLLLENMLFIEPRIFGLVATVNNLYTFGSDDEHP